MLKLIPSFFLLFTGLIVTGQTGKYSLQTDRSIEFAQLENGFQNPPSESRLRCYWWWLNSMATKESITRDLEEMKSNGYTNGKRFVAAEGPTSIGPQWERSPKDLKGNIDRVFCSGVNRIVWHTFTSSPKEFGIPGNEYFAGTHLNPNVTWWKQSKDFISYLNRCSYLLQQGLFVADVLYYYGDDVPNFVFLKSVKAG